MADQSVLVPLLPGFEEIEAVTLIDVLRRAEIPVVVASEAAGAVEGSHGVSVLAPIALADVAAGDLAAIVLPGGLPGAQHLADSPAVQRLIRAVAAAGGYTCAICAAPMALAAAGVHEGHRVTSYPGFDRYLDGAQYVEDRVVVDGKVATSRGPGTALEFALTLVGLLRGSDIEKQIEQQMLALR